jgi:hypothetical protein
MWDCHPITINKDYYDLLRAERLEPCAAGFGRLGAFEAEVEEDFCAFLAADCISGPACGSRAGFEKKGL